MYTLRLGMVANLLLQQSAFTEVEGRHEQRYEGATRERNMQKTERSLAIHNND
jgi:hypothetical protein